MLHPDYPVIEGRYQLTKEWAIVLDDKYNRRVEDGDMIIWGNQKTIFLIAYDMPENSNPTNEIHQYKQVVSPDAYDIEEAVKDGIMYYSYRLKEAGDDNRVPAFYGIAASFEGFVTVSMYFDDEALFPDLKKVFYSLGPN